MTADDPWRRRAQLVLAVSGTGVAATLILLPWLRYALTAPGAGSFLLEQNGLHAEPEWMGWAALVTAVLVAAGAAAGRALGAHRHPLGPRFDGLVALGSLITGDLLIAKFLLTLDKRDFLGNGARLSLALAAVFVTFGMVVAPGSLRTRARGG